MKNNFDSDFAKKRIRFYALHSYLQMSAFYTAIEEMNQKINEKLYGEHIDLDSKNATYINTETIKKYLNTNRELSRKYYRLLCEFLMITQYSHPEEISYINVFDTWYSTYKARKKSPTPREVFIYFKENIPNSIFEGTTSKEFYMEARLKEQLETYSTKTLCLFYCDMDFILETMDNNDYIFFHCYATLNNYGTSLVSEILGILAKQATKYKDEITSYYDTLLKNNKRPDYIQYDFKEIQEMIIAKLHQYPYDYTCSLIELLNVYNKFDNIGKGQLKKFRQYYKTLESYSIDPQESIKQILHFMDTLTVIPSTSSKPIQTEDIN